MRICLVSPGPAGSTETFIQAHLDHLPHDIVPIHGHEGNYHWQDRPLRDWHRGRFERGTEKLLNLLPRFIEFRLRQRYFPPPSNEKVTADFLRHHRIEVVLAEYGTVAAEIMPACAVAGIPLVAHFHGFDASRHDILESYYESYRRLFEYAAAIISVSDPMSEALCEMGCPPQKIRKNPYGPAPEFFEIEPDHGSNTLIAVGRLTEKKAPYLTLEAFRRALLACPELKLCMVGEGRLFEICEHLVAAWEIQDRVELVGASDPASIRDRMGNAFAFVQHSIRARNGDAEGTPVAILEAGAAGLPVVSTRHAGIPEVVVDGETGFLVEPGDVQAMSNRMIELAHDRDRTQSMGKAARSRITSHYSMERHLTELDRILKSAANSKSMMSSAF